MAVEWRKDLEVGVDLIDEQHKELFRRFNTLLEACNKGKGKDEVSKLLHFLDDYIFSHFAAEERLQRQVNYPEFESHRSQHQEFVRELKNLETEYETEGVTTALVIRMNQIIVSWLIQHISKRDLHLANFVKGTAA